MRADDLKKLLAEDRDLLKMIVEETLQQVLEAEMDEALQASKGERTAGRLGYRAGYYSRRLVTRVGHIELRCRKTGRDASAQKSSSGTSGVRKRSWRRCWRCMYKACLHAR
jgi:transposase-like protein